MLLDSICPQKFSRKVLEELPKVTRLLSCTTVEAIDSLDEQVRSRLHRAIGQVGGGGHLWRSTLLVSDVQKETTTPSGQYTGSEVGTSVVGSNDELEHDEAGAKEKNGTQREADNFPVFRMDLQAGRNKCTLFPSL